MFPEKVGNEWTISVHVKPGRFAAVSQVLAISGLLLPVEIELLVKRRKHKLSSAGRWNMPSPFPYHFPFILPPPH